MRLFNTLSGTVYLDESPEQFKFVPDGDIHFILPVIGQNFRNDVQLADKLAVVYCRPTVQSVGAIGATYMPNSASTLSVKVDYENDKVYNEYEQVAKQGLSADLVRRFIKIANVLLSTNTVPKQGGRIEVVYGAEYTQSENYRWLPYATYLLFSLLFADKFQTLNDSTINIFSHEAQEYKLPPLL